MNRKILLTISLAVIVLNSCATTQPLPPATATRAEPVLASDQQQSSYAQGVNYIQNLQKFAIPLDQDLFIQGIKDVLAKRPLRLDPAALQKAQDWVFVQSVLFNEKLAKINREKSQAFLDANKTKPGVVTTASGLQYKELKAGKSKRKPKLSDSAQVYYRINLLNGHELTNNYNKPKPEAIAVNNLMPGWQEAMQRMPEGAKWQLYVPADLAYGDNGVPNQVGPGETLIYEVTLVSIDAPGKNQVTNNSIHTLNAEDMQQTSSWKRP